MSCNKKNPTKKIFFRLVKIKDNSKSDKPIDSILDNF